MIVRNLMWALPLELIHIVLAVQPSALPPIPAPLRELPWAQLNFLHTTDTHGWHAGHLQEPSFGADWGDYVSFATRMREKADEDGVDLLLIDTGDRIEGNGLYDASHPKGKYDMEIFDEQQVDVLCSGNHELYKRSSIDLEFNTTVPRFGDHYIASNLDVIDPEDGERKPLAQRFKTLTTKNQGIRIMAMGFLFDFNGGADNIVVQRVEDTVKEKWFKKAISDRDVDLFLIIGHVAVKSIEYEAIYKAIRQQQWDRPIQFFGGHTHIRDYVKYDAKAWALESGRYMETIGFASINGLNTGGKKTMSPSDPPLQAAAKAPRFSRRYIDNNLFSLHYHSGLNETTFPTPHGLNVSREIQDARAQLDLDRTYGCVPQDYWTNRAPFPSRTSIFSLLQENIFPEKVVQENRQDTPRIVLTNTGAIRFDVFKGKFTVDTMYTVSPFTSGFRYVKDVPWKQAKLLLQILNQEVPQLWPIDLASEMRSLIPASDDDAHISAHVRTDPASHGDVYQQQLGLSTNTEPTAPLIPGYTTRDAAGTDGDDTIHSPIQFYKVPNCIESRISFPQDGQHDPETVDVVYNEFLQKYVLLSLRFLGTDYDEKSTAGYADGKTMTTLLGEWVKDTWKCDADAKFDL